jgi:hypothetical protein
VTVTHSPAGTVGDGHLTVLSLCGRGFLANFYLLGKVSKKSFRWEWPIRQKKMSFLGYLEVLSPGDCGLLRGQKDINQS